MKNKVIKRERERECVCVCVCVCWWGWRLREIVRVSVCAYPRAYIFCGEGVNEVYGAVTHQSKQGFNLPYNTLFRGNQLDSE